MDRVDISLLMSVSMCFIAACAEAAPVNIFDAGNTKPIAPYYERFTSGAAGGKRGQSYRRALEGRSSVAHLPLRCAIEAQDVVPIHTPQMRPGRVKSRFVATRLPHPLFLVGADADSLRWLVAQRKTLQAIGATGMLVEVATVEELHTVADAAQGLSIVPASASDIARSLDIDRYPVLITREGIQQ